MAWRRSPPAFPCLRAMTCSSAIFCGILLRLIQLVAAPESLSGLCTTTDSDIRDSRLILLRDEPARRLNELGTVSDSSAYLERTFLSPASLRAGKLIQGWMQEAGLETWIDDIGNVHGRSNCGNSFAPALLLGSHLDTVVDAGRYDGALGIVCAIAAVKALHMDAKLHKYPRPIEIIAFSDEEGVRYQSTFLGSNAIAGTFNSELLDAVDKRGIKLKQALKNANFPGTEASISQLKYSSVSVWGYLEVHIEQGPVLEARGLPLGIVEAISGQTRLQVTLKGKQGHAGTVPMNMRKDPMTAAAQAIVSIERLCQGALIVCTVGEIATWPGASNVIPGEVKFTLDIRAKDDSIRKNTLSDIERNVHDICNSRAVTCEIQRKHDASAIRSSEDLVKRLQAAAGSALQELSGCPGNFVGDKTLPSLPLLSSGAGHDAMALASFTKVGMLFVRCEGGISHSPAENVLEDDIGAASMALYEFLNADITEVEHSKS